MSTRRLAAIMFTDIAGYTSMMQSNETKALTIRQRHREIFEQYHATFSGTILQYYGDGTLSIFDSAIDAVKCAIEMQLAFQEDPVVPLRIGIHTGDILYSKEEAVGDGVNVASRVESLATPGSVFISESVHRYIRNQVEIPVVSMGEFTFKNVEEPLEVFAVSQSGIDVPKPKTLTGKFTKHQRPGKQNLWERMPIWAKYVAGFVIFLVLAPFIYFPLIQMVSGNAADQPILVTDEFGNTLTREIIQEGDKKRFYVTPFKVIEGDDSSKWMNKGIPYALEMDWDQDPYVLSIFPDFSKLSTLNEDILKAKKSKCKYVLRGEAQKIKDSYQIKVQIYNVANSQLTSEESYEGKNIFTLLDTISLATKRILGVPQAHIDQVKDLPIHQFLTESETAFKHFGNALYGRANGDFFPFEHLKKAISEDSTFATALHYTSQLHFRYQRSKKLAEAFSYQAMRHRKRLPKIFEVEIRQSHYSVIGQPDKALKLAKMLVQLHPENYAYHSSLISEYLLQEKYEEALVAIELDRKISKEPFDAIGASVICLMRLNRANEAIPLLEKYLAQNPTEVNLLVDLGLFYVQEKDFQKATQSIEKALLISPENNVYERLLDYVQFQKDSLASKPKNWIEDFKGTYWIEHFTTFEMTMEANSNFLLGQATNQGKYHLYPISSTTFTGKFDILLTFKRNEKNEVVRVFSSEAGRNAYPAIKMEKEMLEGVKLFKESKWKEAEQVIKVAVSKYPQYDFLANMLAHVQIRNAPGFEDKQTNYNELVGIYQYKGREIELVLDSAGNPSLTSVKNLDIDPITLYEFEKDTLMSLVNLKGYYKLIRKNGILIAIELPSDGNEMIRFEKI